MERSAKPPIEMGKLGMSSAEPQIYIDSNAGSFEAETPPRDKSNSPRLNATLNNVRCWNLEHAPKLAIRVVSVGQVLASVSNYHDQRR